MSLLKKNDGFLLVEILIAGLIITTSIAATMYLFRVGFQHLERINVSNQLSSKLSQSINFLKVIDIEKEEGVEEMGDGVTLAWKAEILEKIRPVFEADAGITVPSAHEIYLYKMNFRLRYKDVERDYGINVLKYKTLVSIEDVL